MYQVIVGANCIAPSRARNGDDWSTHAKVVYLYGSDRFTNDGA